MTSIASGVTGLVSTVIPVHNRGGMLREAVQSVLDQTYRPIEVLIVDDGSTDDTGMVADALASEYSGIVRILHQRNAGAGPARQAGLEASRGEYIQFLDSDDLLLPQKFALQVTGLRGHPDAGISYGLTLLRNEATGEEVPTHGTEHEREALLPAIVQGRLWATLTPLYRRAVCAAIGPWASWRVLEDWDYDWRAALLGVRLHYRPEALAVIRHHGWGHTGLAWLRNREVARDRASALDRMLGYAEQAGVPNESAELQHFARSLFLVSRQYGAAGYPRESHHLFALARRASGAARARGADFLLYEMTASLLGWKTLGRLSAWIDQKRR